MAERNQPTREQEFAARAWCAEHGIRVPSGRRVPTRVWEAYQADDVVAADPGQVIEHEYRVPTSELRAARAGPRAAAL